VRLARPVDRTPWAARHAQACARIAGGESAMRWLKRKLSDIVYKTMLNDLVASAGTGPGGHRGNVSDSSAAGSHPHTSSSDKSLPGPANRQPRTPLQPRLDTEGSHERTRPTGGMARIWTARMALAHAPRQVTFSR